jgi:hypothetical protein
MAFGTGLFILASGATVIMLLVLRVVGLIWADVEPNRDPGGREGSWAGIAMQCCEPFGVMLAYRRAA